MRMQIAGEKPISQLDLHIKGTGNTHEHHTPAVFRREYLNCETVN